MTGILPNAETGFRILRPSICSSCIDQEQILILNLKATIFRQTKDIIHPEGRSEAGPCRKTQASLQQPVISDRSKANKFRYQLSNFELT